MINGFSLADTSVFHCRNISAWIKFIGTDVGNDGVSDEILNWAWYDVVGNKICDHGTL